MLLEQQLKKLMTGDVGAFPVCFCSHFTDQDFSHKTHFLVRTM